MIRTLKLLTMGALSVLVLALTACGGDDAGSGGSTNASPGADDNAKALAADAKTGGALIELASSDVDYLDPGQTYYQFGYQVSQSISRNLYGYQPTNNEPIPDIADGDPEISDDQKTVTVKIKPGIKYGPPVNREVVCKDVKYAFERGFSKQVNNQYSFYYQSIEGFPEKPTDGVKDVSGITCQDDNTIVFTLSKPVGSFLAVALVMPITSPVPEEFASKFDAKSPTTYNEHVVATGPYMIPGDASGKLTGYNAGKSIKLVRNPNWDKATDHRPAYLDSILIKTNATDANIAAQQVLKGKNLILDTNPPANVLAQLVTKTKGQYMQVGAGGMRYVSLNTTIKPLSDVNVRKAIAAGISRDALRKARGGKFIGSIPTHYIPPGVPGHEEAGGLEGPGVDYLTKEGTGDPAVAKKYFQAAGFASGRYEGSKELLMIGANAEPGKSVSEAAKGELEKLGFKIRLRLVPQDAVYTEWCQVPDKKVAFCASAGWFKDFSDGQTIIQPIFDGRSINPTGAGNNNLGLLNDPKVNAAIDVGIKAAGSDRAQAWADADKAAVNALSLVPYVWDNTTLVRSKNVNGVADDNSSSLWDLNYTSIK